MADVPMVLRSIQREKQYYSQGWNAYVQGQKYDIRAKSDWKCGWRDCEAAKPEERVLI